MPDAFMSSDEFDERAHQLYNEARYDEAVALLREGLQLYPDAIELHIGLGYARLAREEYAWARRAFEDALRVDADHEDALAGLGEVRLKLGQVESAVGCFDRVLALGFDEDLDLVLQMGRACFREGHIEQARRYFTVAREAHPESAEATACCGYAAHRLSREREAVKWLRRALALEGAHSEARIYLGNLLYDRGEFEAALYHFEQTAPDDHLDELAVWRLIELKKSIYRLEPDDPELGPWTERLAELATDTDPIDDLLAEIEATQPDGTVRDPLQLELFGTLLMELDGMRRRGNTVHRVTTRGQTYNGTWEEIVQQMQADDPDAVPGTVEDYMEHVARRQAAAGIVLPATDAESFLLASAVAGLLKIVR
jgi:tetratricopeptide (TPR) repeat protein